MLFRGYFGFKVGGEACIRHFFLRLILCLRGYIPWNYARFLNYATDRLLLQRVGGRYRFNPSIIAGTLRSNAVGERVS
jgi:hypothetical protein